MQLKALRLGVMTLAGAVLLALTLPTPRAAAQSAEEAEVSSEREAEQLRIQRAVLDLISRTGERRDREVRDLRKYASGAAREYLDSQIAWIEEIERGDPRVMYETALRLRVGDGLPQHRRAALAWFERAGDHGVPEGHYAAVLMLLDEPDNFLNRIMVEDLLKRAARKGVAEAQRDLGMRLIAADPQSGGSYRAYHWLLLAQANGADVDTDALTEASAPLSAEQRLAVGLKISLAVGKSVSTNWPHDWDTGEKGEVRGVVGRRPASGVRAPSKRRRTEPIIRRVRDERGGDAENFAGSLAASVLAVPGEVGLKIAKVFFRDG